MAKHSNHIEGNTDSAAGKYQEPKILGEEMMKPENLKLAQTLIKQSATAEEKLQAAEKLAELHFPTLDIQDTDGKVRHLDITTDRGSNGRKIVQVFADDQVALRGVDDNGKFGHQFDDRRNTEVAFSGDRFKQSHAGSALLGAEQKSTADTTKHPSFKLTDLAPLKIDLEPHLKGGGSDSISAPIGGESKLALRQAQDPAKHVQEIKQWLNSGAFDNTFPKGFGAASTALFSNKERVDVLRSDRQPNAYGTYSRLFAPKE